VHFLALEGGKVHGRLDFVGVLVRLWTDNDVFTILVQNRFLLLWRHVSNILVLRHMTQTTSVMKTTKIYAYIIRPRISPRPPPHHSSNPEHHLSNPIYYPKHPTLNSRCIRLGRSRSGLAIATTIGVNCETRAEIPMVLRTAEERHPSGKQGKNAMECNGAIFLLRPQQTRQTISIIR
jgi:hypothetical protein